MLVNLVILVGCTFLTSLEAKPQNWPDRQEWNQKDWRQKWPGWPEPSVYTPAQPVNSWWEQHEATRTAPAPLPPTTPAITSTPKPSASIDNACNSIRKLQKSSKSANYTATVTVPAALAYECINSVPFNRTGAVALLDSIRPYLEWQTTLQWVKDPPAEYAEKVQAPYDFWAEWERLYNQTKAGDYENEYQFGFDLYTIFSNVRDGHFTMYPDSATSVFTWGRTTPLVSISLDGISIPQVYVYQDVLDAVVGNATFTPSPLTEIDGRNSTEFLLEWAQLGVLQDPDALWNNMFYLLPQVSLGSSGSGTGTFSGGGRGRAIYPGANTTLSFANGSTIINDNYARVGPNFTNITSGADIYREFFIPRMAPDNADEIARETTSSTTSSSTSSTTSTPAPGFPTPVIRQEKNQNSGYFLKGEGYDDVAVLSVASFVGGAGGQVSFQAVNTYFLERALRENKTKLIIDVSANGGGTILLGYDLFKQLFPFIDPYGANRFRVHEAYDLIGQEISYFSGLVNRSLDLNDTASSLVSSNFNYRTDKDADGRNFTSWKEKVGPQTFGPGPDEFTPVFRWNLSDVLTPLNSGGITVSGYGNRSNVTTGKFAPENIVVVTDGYCASTCTIFSELMRQQAGVKYINLGGRPNTDITQAIGGVKGTNSLAFGYLLNTAVIPYEYRYIHSEEYYNKTELGKYNNLWKYRTGATVVNARDGFRQDDPTLVPLQFKYEPADCRIFYTPEMAVDMDAAWKTIADTAFNGIDHCVAGGIQTSGGQKRATKPRKKHRVRKDLRLRDHHDSLTSVWTGRDEAFAQGDCRMPI